MLFAKHARCVASGNNERYTPGIIEIILFSFYGFWQMGITFFSSTALSVNGKTPLPVNSDYTSIIIIIGYIASAVMLGAFSKHGVTLLRCVMLVSLGASISIFMPFPETLTAVLLYIQEFCCVFMICGYIFVVVTRFSARAEISRIVISMLILGIGTAVLQNDDISIPFSAFNLISCICQTLITVFLFTIPKASPEFLSREKKRQGAPRLQVAGFLFLAFSTGLIVCFASNYSESVHNGVSVMYMGLIPGTCLFYHLYRKKIEMTKIFRILIFIALLGFVTALSSETFTVLKHTACFLLGMSIVCGEFFTYYGIFVFTKYPTKALAPLAAVSALFAAGLSMLLLSLLRERITLLYGVYAIVAAVFVLLYSFLEPIFKFRTDEAADELSGSGELLSGYIAAEAVAALSDSEKPEKAVEAKAGDEAAKAESGSSEPGEVRLIFSELSLRENTLAELILQGYTESDICSIMNISVNTQKSYRKSVYTKLDIHSKRELFERYEMIKQ